jgi:hypothetical protein
MPYIYGSRCRSFTASVRRLRGPLGNIDEEMVPVHQHMVGDLGHLKMAATEDEDLAIAVLAEAEICNTVIPLQFPGFRVRVVKESVPPLLLPWPSD